MCPIWTLLKKKKSNFLWKRWGEEVEQNCLDGNTKIGGGLAEPQQRRLSESYPCWACLWWVWTGTVRTWRSHACIFSCSSSLLLRGSGVNGGCLEKSAQKEDSSFRVKIQEGLSLWQSLATGQGSFSLPHSSGCVSVAFVSVCGRSDDHEWVERSDGGLHSQVCMYPSWSVARLQDKGCLISTDTGMECALLSDH